MVSWLQEGTTVLLNPATKAIGSWYCRQTPYLSFTWILKQKLVPLIQETLFSGFPWLLFRTLQPGGLSLSYKHLQTMDMGWASGRQRASSIITTQTRPQTSSCCQESTQQQEWSHGHKGSLTLHLFSAFLTVMSLLLRQAMSSYLGFLPSASIGSPLSLGSSQLASLL